MGWKENYSLLKFWLKKRAFPLLVYNSEVFGLDPKARTTFTFYQLLTLSLFIASFSFPAVVTEKPPEFLHHREEFTQLRNEMLSGQQVLLKAGVNVVFWPPLNPVSEHPHAPAVLFHPAKHYLPA